jgi:hypothetical protein
MGVLLNKKGADKMDYKEQVEVWRTAKTFQKVRYVYIAGPYSGGDTILNIRAAVMMAEELLKLELIPYIPHLTAFWHIIAPHEYEFWLEYDLNWLSKCDALIRLPGESGGADKEIEYAEKMGIPVFYSLDGLRI